MQLRLVITTDGREGLLERALESFDQHVKPRPVHTVVVDDSGDRAYHRYLDDLLSYRMGVYGGRANLLSHPSRVGFCETVADAWTLAGDPRLACPGCDVERSDYRPASLEEGTDEEGRECPRCGFSVEPPKVTAPDWVFWLEDDFVFERSVPLVDLAYVMQMRPQVAQMSLYRNPVSDEEKKAGGLLNIGPDRFTRRGSGTSTWIEHQAYWTTNPSLFPRVIAERYPWPTVDHCEGVFGIELREQRKLLIDDEEVETTFGIWGHGDPWVRHDAKRAGKGY